MRKEKKKEEICHLYLGKQIQGPDITSQCLHIYHKKLKIQVFLFLFYFYFCSLNCMIMGTI